VLILALTGTAAEPAPGSKDLEHRVGRQGGRVEA
jgi:hypothetical protein